MEDKYAAQPEQEIAPKTPDADDVDALLQDVKSLLGETDDSAVLGPMTREEGLLLTQYNSAQVILESWRAKDYARLYRFTAQGDGKRPTQEAFNQELSSMPRALIDFTLEPGSVSEDGQT